MLIPVLKYEKTQEGIVMDYNKIILELLDRIKSLEERVSKLEGNNTDEESSEKTTETKASITGGQKYRALSSYLVESGKERVRLSFSEIEEILGFALSPSARKYEQYWANSTSQTLARGWLKVGYYKVEVNLPQEYVVFEKKIV